MPSVSKKQHNFMAAVANNPKFAKKAGVPSSVGKEFLTADKGKTFKQGGVMKKKIRKFESGGMAALRKMAGYGGAEMEGDTELMDSSNAFEKAKRLGLRPGSRDFRKVMEQSTGGATKKNLANLRSDLQYSARNLGEVAGMTPAGMGLRSIKKARDMMPNSYDEEIGMKKGGIAKTVTKEMEYDYKTGKKSFRGDTEQRDRHAEKEGKIVAKHAAYDKAKGMKKGGMAKESKMMVKKEVEFMKKKGAPKSMIKHEKAEAGMKYGGMAKKMAKGGMSECKTIAKKEVKSHEKRMHKMAGGGKVGQLSKADGCATKGKSKGTMVKMKYGGSC